MKTEQHQQAQHLYFQTDLSQAEIAQLLGVSRATLNTWAREGDWARIRVSAQHMPCLITENLYMVMAKLTENILSELRIMRPVTKAEADTLRSISLTIKNLNGRSSVNESLEMMSFFIEDVNSKDPEMAQKIKPFITEYIAARAAVQPGQFMHSRFNHMGHIPATDASPSPLEVYPDPSSGSCKSRLHREAGERSEDKLDIEDLMAQTQTPPSEGERVPGASPSPLEVYPDPSSGSCKSRLHREAGERSEQQHRESNLTQPNTAQGTEAAKPKVDWNQYQEHVKQQAEEKATRKQVIADAEETIKSIQQANLAKNKHLNRAQRRELERQAKAAKKQYPKAA